MFNVRLWMERLMYIIKKVFEKNPVKSGYFSDRGAWGSKYWIFPDKTIEFTFPEGGRESYLKSNVGVKSKSKIQQFCHCFFEIMEQLFPKYFDIWGIFSKILKSFKVSLIYYNNAYTNRL